MIRPIFSLLVASTAFLGQICSALELHLQSVEPAATPRYGKCEITFDIPGAWNNPYDPDEIDVTARFTSPSGKITTVPGFFYQPFCDRNAGNGSKTVSQNHQHGPPRPEKSDGFEADSKTPRLDEAGPPCWKARFTPTEVGRYSGVIQARGRSASDVATSPPLEVVCVDSDVPGFIRVSPKNKRYFQFDDGKAFFPVGQNLQNDWPVYKHSRLLAEGGANAARVWTFCHWTWLEWTPAADLPWAGPGHWMRSYAGAGKYNQRIAWIADHHLEQWTRDGLRLMFCLGNATGDGELSKGSGYANWGGHPYNKANGGFLDRPEQFWTDPHAKKLYKQKLRYLVARYAYSPNVWAWELWNELGEATPEIVAWHKEMADYLHDIDPYRHLITTSTWEHSCDKFAAAWNLDQLDFTQSHIYEALPAVQSRIAEHLARWARPHIVGEGGGPPPPADPQAIEFHNALWGPVALGAAGTTLPWWWRERIEPQNLFSQYRAVAAFVADVPWTERVFRPVKISSVSVPSAAGRKKFSPVLIVPLGAGWNSRAPRDQFVVEADGQMPHNTDLGTNLYGRGRAAWRNPPTIAVSYPRPGQFILRIGKASHGVLEIDLDGRQVLRDASFDRPKTKTPKDVVVDVPAGRHKIRLDNAGSDWITIEHILLTNYRDTTRYPDLDILGLESGDMALLWIHNRLHQAAFQAAGVAADPIGPGTITLPRLRDGQYEVQWWNTYRGSVVASDRTTCAHGELEIHLPVVATDVACKIRSRF